MTTEEKIEQLSKAVSYYLENEPDDYRLEFLIKVANRFMVSSKLLRRALRLLEEESTKITRRSRERAMKYYYWRADWKCGCGSIYYLARSKSPTIKKQHGKYWTEETIVYSDNQNIREKVLDVDVFKPIWVKRLSELPLKRLPKTELLRLRLLGVI